MGAYNMIIGDINVNNQSIKGAFDVGYLTDPKYIKVTTDERNRLISGITKDGICHIPQLDSPIIDEITNELKELSEKKLDNEEVQLIASDCCNGNFDYSKTFDVYNGYFMNYIVKPNTIYKIIWNEDFEGNYCFLKNNNPVQASDISGCKCPLEPNATVKIFTPKDCMYLYIEGRFPNVKIFETNEKIDKLYYNNDVRSKIIYSINKSHRYTFNVVLPHQFPGFDDIEFFGGSDESHIRPVAQICYTLGTQIFNGCYDSYITGHSLYAAKKQFVRLTNNLTNWHRSLKGESTPYAWGKTWQSALWTFYIGAGAVLNKDLFTTEEYNNVVTMVEYEADIQVNNTSDSANYMVLNDGTVLHPGDTKLEEVAWNNSVIGIAILMTTDQIKLASYKRRFVESCCIAHAQPDDYLSDKVINGYPLSNLHGWNLNPDGSATNHNIIHPGYALDSGCSLYGAVGVMIYLHEKVPNAAWFNLDKITQCLIERDFTKEEGFQPPYGTIYKPGTYDIYYPNGNDWGIVLGITQAGIDVIADMRALNPSAGWNKWANIHMSRVLYYHNRKETGQYYLPGENSLSPETYENETYESTKLCVSLSYLNEYLIEDDSDWYNQN